MASKKDLKKNLNNMVFDIVEECFTVSLLDDSKTVSAEKIIDETAEFQDSMLVQINRAKTKKDFGPIREKIEKSAIDFIEKLNGLN
jgi:hypothetical protein